MRYGLSVRSGPPEPDLGLRVDGPSDDIRGLILVRRGVFCDRAVSLGRTWYDAETSQGVLQLKFNNGIIIQKFGPSHFPKRGQKVNGKSVDNLMPGNLRDFEAYALTLLETECDRIEVRKSGTTFIPELKNKVRQFIEENAERNFYGHEETSSGIRG